MLGSYSNALPGQESSSGQALPRYCVSDRSAFGSMPNVEWQQLEVRPACGRSRYFLSRRAASVHPDIHMYARMQS